MRTIKIEMTGRDVEDGAAYEGADTAIHCPIAHAARRTFGQVVFVGADCLYDSSYNVIADLPESARDFVARYDEATPRQKKSLRPVSFRVHVNR